MYVYQSYESKKKKGWIFFVIIFFVALVGAYCGQILFIETEKIESNEAQRLSNNQLYYPVMVEETHEREEMLAQAMKSVVGISKLKANEESIFDIAVNQKWGLRNRNYCLKEWIYFNELSFSGKNRK